MQFGIAEDSVSRNILVGGVCYLCLVFVFLPRSWAKERYDIIGFCFLCVYSETHASRCVYVELAITEDCTSRHIFVGGSLLVLFGFGISSSL